jgi:hypothetical protein
MEGHGRRGRGGFAGVRGAHPVLQAFGVAATLFEAPIDFIQDVEQGALQSLDLGDGECVSSDRFDARW